VVLDSFAALDSVQFHDNSSSSDVPRTSYFCQDYGFGPGCGFYSFSKNPSQNFSEIQEPCTQSSVGIRDKPFVEKGLLSNSLSADNFRQVQCTNARALKALRNYEVFKEARQQMEMMLLGIVDAPVTALEILSSLEYTQTFLLSCATTVPGRDFFALANRLKSRDWTAEEQDEFALKFSTFVPGSWPGC
jgi:hypothetical protein